MIVKQQLAAVLYCATVSLLAGIVLTPLVRRLAIRLDFVDKPNRHKPSCRAVPLLGGLALYLATVGGYAVFEHVDLRSLWLIAGAGLLLVLGLVDDRFTVPARLRMAIQFVGALGVVSAGVRFHWFAWEFADYAISILWLMGVTNAINCMDCADGIAAGVGAITAAGYCAIALLCGHWAVSLMAAALAGACLSFLRYNYPPASIFLGDAGSTVLGFLLGALAIAATRGAPAFTQAWMAALPVAVPVWDIVVVHLRRRRVGVRGMRELLESNGHDHLPHRLGERGLSARQTAAAVYMMSGVFAAAGVVVCRDGWGALLAAMGLTLLALVTGEMPFGALVARVSEFVRLRWESVRRGALPRRSPALGGQEAAPLAGQAAGGRPAPSAGGQ